MSNLEVRAFRPGAAAQTSPPTVAAFRHGSVSGGFRPGCLIGGNPETRLGRYL